MALDKHQKNNLILSEQAFEHNRKQRVVAVIFATCTKWKVNPYSPLAWVPIARRLWDAIEDAELTPNGWTYQTFIRSIADKVWDNHMRAYGNSRYSKNQRIRIGNNKANEEIRHIRSARIIDKGSNAPCEITPKRLSSGKKD